MNERHAPSMPLILVVEDDLVSAAYLSDATASLPAQVDVAGSVAEAVALAASHAHPNAHALLLIDAHLPDGSGQALLQALRDRGITAPALAHTAAGEIALRDELLATGFVEVLRKPIGVTDLKLALQRHLPRAIPASAQMADLPRWDDAASLAALGGQRANVDALRGLFREELPGQRHRITKASSEGNEIGVRDELHRLVASCGFVGAARLGHAVRQLHAMPLDAKALATLQSEISEVLKSGWTSGG